MATSPLTGILGGAVTGSFASSDPAPSYADTTAAKIPIQTPRTRGKYQAHLMKYPLDIGSPQHQNYIMFYINVQTDSKVKNNNLAEIADTQPSRAAMNSIVGKPFDEDVLAAAQLAQGAIAGGVAGIVGGGDAVGKITGAVGGALIGGTIGFATAKATVAAAEYANIQFSPPAKRLKEAIVLYTPHQLSVRYGMQWSEEEMSIAISAATNPEIANQLKAVAAASASGGSQNSDDPAKSTGLGTSFNSIVASEVFKKSPSLSAATRSAGNPRKEQIFKGVDYRRFTFDYQFYPKSPIEAQAALNIIWLFKYHMHPEFKDSSNFVYVYPSEFDIEYFINGSPNDNLNRISSCVLTEMNVNYSPNGVFSTFPDGTPTQINLTLNFVELETLTKERIEAGL
jgi:hypothetical protein